MYIKKIITGVALLFAALPVFSQSRWNQFDKLMTSGSYKSAYTLAEGVYHQCTVSSERLAAAFHMTLAASNYQEDVHDSAEARYRALLPTLEPLEKAICYAFLGEYDSALVFSDVLKTTPVEKIKMYCDAERSVGMTPTAFDVVVRRILNDYNNNKTTVQQRVELQRMLVDFHAGDGDDIRIWNENCLLDYLSFVPNHPLSLARIGESIAKFRGTKSPWFTLLYERAAQWCDGKEDFVAALRYCDTAIQLAPKSEGGVGCANLRNEILQKCVEMDNDGLVVAPNAVSLQRVRYRNLDYLWWRIIPYDSDYRWGDKTKAKLRAAKAVESGVWKVESGKDYKYAESYVSLPALKTGKWLLLVSPSQNFMADGFMAYEVNVTDMYLIQNGQEGLLLDRRTGKPIAGQELLLKKLDYRNTQLLERAHTDSTGRYRFTTKEFRYDYKIIIKRDGYTIDASYGRAYEKPDSTMKLNATMCTDRPVYKPGDTVQVAAVVYRCNGLDAQVAANEEVELLFKDPHWQEVEKQQLATDDFGVAYASFAIPTDRTVGVYHIEVRSTSKNEFLRSEAVRVEEYKQPKFMVTLGTRTASSAQGGADEAVHAPRFGQPYTVHGLAASYSAVPVSGARVQYTVTRREMYRRWWRYNSWESPSVIAEVASGELTTAADGSFDITFTPEPDSSVELSTKPSFLYIVTAIVTDLNGESHEQTYNLRVGFQNAFLSLEKGSTMENLKVKYFDLNGNDLPGKVDMKIERLQQPQPPLLDSPLMRDGAHHTVREADFLMTFPMLAYNKDYNNPDRWPVAEEVESGKRKMESGVYRITLTAEGADVAVEYITHTEQDARKVQCQKLLWSEVDKQKAEVGEMVRLRFGSRFKDVDVYYLLRIGNEERDFRHINVSDELKYIDISVDSAMLGGFQVDLVALREGISEKASFGVTVPFSHKELKVEISTFRDKLLPGETEEWTIMVKRKELGVKSSLIMTMYDDALNSYENPVWAFSPWRCNSSAHLRPYYIRGEAGYWMEEYKHLYYNGQQPSVWILKEALPYYNRWGHRMYRAAAMAKNNVAVLGEEELEVAPEVTTELSIVSDDAVKEESAVLFTGGEAGSNQHEQVRTNLNTLAFFVPALRTNADGTVSYHFTVLELLTRWNVKGLAFTKDLKTGTLDKALITSKPLMVQPNVPRFLRSGDSLSLMAKVILDEELRTKNEELPVEVIFLLTDAATCDTLTFQHRQVRVKDAAQVMFLVRVPRDVYVVTYKIVASAEGGVLNERKYGDGERGQIPVVSSRQAVTLSQPVYINGAGEKSFHFSLSTFLSPTAEPHFLGVELVSNPVWLAIKSMPYLKQQENPSSLYLANQLYVNSLANNILKDFKDLKDLKALTDTSNTRLNVNEDVKQTLLEATPWLRDAEAEVEQRKTIANYFDSARMAEEFTQLQSQLSARQNADGGWSWMPEGESSTWVTMQILKRLSILEQSNDKTIRQSLAYVDREEQRHYEKYIKPYMKKYKWKPDNIDYLYTRSFFGKGNTEAYKFYYSNALKNYRNYNNLYTQAQLALIFQRHGDKNAAHDLIRRFKEKSLINDEMGMYWRDNRSGWCWYERPIETQALLIQAFREVTPQDTASIALMQQWLLKQKQTTHWGNDRATVEAIGALITPNYLNTPSNQNTLSALKSTSLILCGVDLTAPSEGLEGYRTQRWHGLALDSVIALGDSTVTLRRNTSGIAWGAVYYQYTDDMDKIPSSESGITLKRTYLNRNNQNIQNTPSTLKVGDRIKVRIEISCDRTMEYLELIDGRPSCVEPLSTCSGWNWNQGLRYYVEVKNTATHCYVNRLEKGKYVVEYEVYVTNPGTFLAGPVTMQCMYAPEFRAVVPAERLVVE
ncbi:MAG: MG2 domain-containing protein [bacterium]